MCTELRLNLSLSVVVSVRDAWKGTKSMASINAAVDVNRLTVSIGGE